MLRILEELCAGRSGLEAGAGYDRGVLGASPYDVLGVAPGASDDELRRAYRVRLRETHPDTGGDAAAFVRVQRAWMLVGTAEARAAYDRGARLPEASTPDFAQPAGGWRPPARDDDTRPRARSHGQPGGRNRERYLGLIREWAGRGADLGDPYDPLLVRSAPREIRHLLADALAEEATARIVADLGIGYTVWHDVAPVRADRDPGKIDHVVLGPSGLYAIASEDAGGPVKLRRTDLVPERRGADAGEIDPDTLPQLVGRARTLGRAFGVRFSGVVVVLPDDDVPAAIAEVGRIKGLPAAVVGRSALQTVLRRGLDGARDIGGTEAFEVRTRLQQGVRFV